MLRRFSVTTKLFLLVFILCGAIISIGIYGLGRLKAMNQNIQTLYADRVFPTEQLTTIRFSYATGIQNTVEQLQSQSITFSDAQTRIEKAEADITNNWQAYKLTYLTADEQKLVAEMETVTGAAQLPIQNIKKAIANNDLNAVKNAYQQLNSSVSVVIAKANELVQLQITVSGELYKNGQQVYAAAFKRFCILMAAVLFIAFVVSFLIVRDTRNLVMKLKESNQKVAKSEERHRALIENIGDAITLFNEKMEVIYRSPSVERINGYTLQDVQSKTLLEIIHPNDRQRCSDYFDQVFAQPGVPQQGQFRLLHKGGYYIWIESTVNNLLQNESVKAIVINYRDITQRKKAEQEVAELNELLEQKVINRTAQLQEANKALESFSYSVSHDLRAPVRAVNGFIQIIAEEHASAFSPELKQLFEHIAVSGKRMNAIIEDLLTLAKYDKIMPQNRQVDMEKLFRNIWDNILVYNPHQAVLKIAPLPAASVDSSLIEQVVVNLLSNAIKYSSKKEKPVVMVSYEKGDEAITYSVKDNGAGFDMKNYNRLFGAFQRLHGASEFEGTGVGLLLVKRIVEKHGGVVRAEGAVNEGATFYFTLPAVQS